MTTKNKISVLLVCFLTVLTFSSCQLFTASLSDLQIGTEIDDETKEVIDPAEVISKTTPTIYASVYMKNAPAGTKLRATWELEGKAISEPIELEGEGSRYAAFTLKKPAEGFRSGEYQIQVEIIDTDEELSKSFVIE